MEKTGGGDLVKKHGVTSSLDTRVVRPAKKPKKSDSSSRKITSFFGAK